jgi:hypothetical protein
VISLTVFLALISGVYSVSYTAEFQALSLNIQKSTKINDELLDKNTSEDKKHDLIIEQKNTVNATQKNIKDLKDDTNIDGNIGSLICEFIDIIMGLVIVKVILYRWLTIKKSFYLLCIDIIEDNIKIYEIKQSNRNNNLSSQEIATTSDDDIEKKNKQRDDRGIKGIINIIHIKR